MKKLGIATIGQSPRNDVTKEIKRIVGKDVEFIEYGALDGLTLEEVKQIKKSKEGGILVTSMRDGTEVKVTHDFVTPRIQQGIYELERKGVDVILLLCTGKFPEIKSNKLVVMPSEIVWGAVNGALRSGKLAVVLPGKEQVRTNHEKRGELDIYYDSASPYGSRSDLELLAKRLATLDLDLIFLNCMGFDHEMKQVVQKITGKPVVQASSVVGRVLLEFLD